MTFGLNGQTSNLSPPVDQLFTNCAMPGIGLFLYFSLGAGNFTDVGMTQPPCSSRFSPFSALIMYFPLHIYGWMAALFHCLPFTVRFWPFFDQHVQAKWLGNGKRRVNKHQNWQTRREKKCNTTGGRRGPRVTR